MCSSIVGGVYRCRDAKDPHPRPVLISEVGIYPWRAAELPETTVLYVLSKAQAFGI